MNNSARSAGQAASTRRGPLAAFTVTVLEVPHSTTNATIQRTLRRGLHAHLNEHIDPLHACGAR